MSLSLKFRENQRAFKKEFCKEFALNLESNSSLALGRSEATVEYGVVGKLVKFCIENIVSNAVGGLPFIGPFAADFLSTVPTQIYERYKKQQIVKDAAEMHNEMFKLGESLMDSLIEEVSHEITRIFEYQVTVMESPADSSRLAIFAVDKIMSKANIYAKQGHHIKLGRNELLIALVEYEDESFFNRLLKKGDLNTILPGNSKVKWTYKDVFVKVGLRTEVDGIDKYQFKINPKFGNNCGFRGPVFQYDDKEKKFITADVDKQYTQIIPKDASRYDMMFVPTQQLVLQVDIEAYVENIQKHPNEVIPFNRFYANRRNIKNEIYPIYRGIEFSKLNISQGDFSNGDMTRINWRGVTFTEGKLANTRMVLAELRDSNMEGSWLKYTDLRWSQIENVILKGDTILTSADLSNAILGLNTDLTDNFTFGSALTSNTVILTDRIVSTVLKRLKAEEERSSRLERRVEELLARDENTHKQIQKRKSVKINSEYDFFNVRTAVNDFVGREDVLVRIHQYFVDYREKQAPVAVVSAGGGMGKTQVILRYVEQYKSEYGVSGYERIYWISAETVQTLAQSFREFAEKLKIVTEKRSDKEVIDDIQRKIMTFECTLFIFDNVDDRNIIKDYIPKTKANGLNHHVIITTRRAEKWPGKYHVEKLTPFSSVEAELYIRNAEPFADEEDILNLANEFGNVPIGLSQAIAYIREYNFTIPEYLDYYHNFNKNADNKDNNNNNVETSALVKSVEKGVSSSGRITKESRGGNETKTVPDNSAENTETDSLSQRQIDTIQVASVKSNQLVSNTLSISIEGLQSNYPGAIELMMICSYIDPDRIPIKLFSSLFGDEKSLLKAVVLLDDSNLLTSKQLPVGRDGTIERFIFVHRLVQKTINQKLVQLGNYLTIFMKTIQLLKENVADCSVKLDPSAVLFKNGSIILHLLSATDKYDEIVQLKSLSFFEKKDLDTLISGIYEAIALYYMETGKFNDSKVILMKGLSLFDSYDNKEDFGEYGSLLHYLGLLYDRTGHYDDSLSTLQRALAIRQNLFGLNHHAVASTLNCIGNIYDSQDKIDKSFECHEQALKIREGLFGVDSIEASSSYYNLARLYKQKYNYEKSLELHERCLRITENHYGRNHPFVAYSLDCIGAIYECKSEYSRAMELYKEALAINRASRNDEPGPFDGYYLKKIGGVHKALGEFDKALELYNQNLELIRQTFGNEHPDVADALESVGQVFEMQGIYDKALDYYQQALRIYEQVHHGDHSSIAYGYDNIGRIYSSLGQTDKALEMFQKGLTMTENIHGPDTVGSTHFLMNIGDVYSNTKKIDEALKIYEKALKIREKVYQDTDDISVLVERIGSCYRDKGNYEEALRYYDRALEIDKKVYGPTHYAVSYKLVNIGYLYHTKNEYRRAIEYYQQGLDVKLKSFASNHPNVAQCYSMIAQSYEKLNEKENALKYYRLVVPIYEQVYDNDYNDLKVIKRRIQNLENDSSYVPVTRAARESSRCCNIL